KAEAGLDTDDHQIECVRQRTLDLLAPRLCLAAQRKVRAKPAEQRPDASKHERVAGMSADTEQEEQHTAQRQSGKNLRPEIVRRSPAVRIARQRKLVADRFQSLF